MFLVIPAFVCHAIASHLPKDSLIFYHERAGCMALPARSGLGEPV